MSGLLKLAAALGVEAALAAFVMVVIGVYNIIRARNRHIEGGQRPAPSRAKERPPS
jgi:hypothetical protein